MEASDLIWWDGFVKCSKEGVILGMSIFQGVWRACIGRKVQIHQAVRRANKIWMMIFHMIPTVWAVMYNSLLETGLLVFQCM